MTFLNVAHQLLLIPLALIGVSFLVGFHEFGHFIFCKIFGIRTPTFSIGFGRRLITLGRFYDTDFIISSIPLGGYVEIAGAEEVGQGEQKEAHSRGGDSFAVKPYYQKMLVISGGILFNLIFAYTVLTALFLVGIVKTPLMYPYNATNSIETIDPKSAAATAQLQPGDRVIRINDIAISDDTMPLLLKTLQDNAGKSINLLIERAGATMPITAQLGNGVKEPMLGARFVQKEIPARPFGEAVVASITTVNQWIVATFGSLKAAACKKSMANFGGPVAIISQTIQSTQQGFSAFFLILCLISVSLAVFNVLPLPIFDGGQALFYTLEAITGKSLDNVRIYVHYVSWFMVLALIAYLSFKDILRICQ
jgi:regulator of sigma E protease